MIVVGFCQDCCCAGSRSGRSEAAGLAPDGGEDGRRRAEERVREEGTVEQED